mmetsp:Transcript_105652/g.281416  ORF Transcript_105652/g.281416 Transcript_105652/m.281416 type:complete len:434 (-) Transcript_105652:318-1619(-)
MPWFRQTSAKSLSVTTLLWSKSKTLFQAEKKLPYLVLTIFLKLARLLTITSCSWCCWVVLLMVEAGNPRSYLRDAFGDQGNVNDFDKSACEADRSAPAVESSKRSMPARAGDNEREGDEREGLDGERPVGEGDAEFEGDREEEDVGREYGELVGVSSAGTLPASLPFFALGDPAGAVPSHIAGRSGGGTPIKSDRRSSWIITFWKRRARSILNSFFALHLCSNPKASQDCRNSASLIRPIFSVSKPFRQASQMELKRPRRSSRAVLTMAWASSSTSLNSMWILFCGCFCNNSCQIAFLFPRKAHSSRIKHSLPNAVVPVESGSSPSRHATTVDPYLFLSDRRKISKWGICASISSLSLVATFLVTVLDRDISLLLPKRVLVFTLDSGSLGLQMNAGSPRCLFRVQLGSRSQMVISCRPGIGCRHLKSFLTSWG